MKIILLSHKTLGEVKEEFTSIYPFLKIEFFKKDRDLPEAEQVKYEEVLSTELSDDNGASVNIKPCDTVKQVEQKFNCLYGLPAHIFRKQNDNWYDTAITDDLTLQEQNIWGREASKPLKIKMENRYNWR